MTYNLLCDKENSLNMLIDTREKAKLKDKYNSIHYDLLSIV